MIKVVAEQAQQNQCEPVHLREGTLAGTQATGLAMKAHIDLILVQIIVKWDFKNAFNEIKRAAVIEVIRDEPSLRFLPNHREVGLQECL